MAYEMVFKRYEIKYILSTDQFEKMIGFISDHTPSLNYAIVILSSPDIKSGETYSLTVGSYTADVTAN